MRILLNKGFASVLVIGLCLCVYWPFNWWIRLLFVTDGYKHPGSYKRKNEDYKRRWSFMERIVLLPLFSRDSTRSFRFLGVINYCHLLLTVFTISGFILCEIAGITMIPWQKGFISVGIVCIIQLFVIKYVL